MQVSVKANLPSNKAIRRELQAAPAKLQRVQRRAITKTAKSVRTHLSSVLREEMNIKKGDLDRRNLKIAFTRGGFGAHLSIHGSRIPLINYEAKQGPRGKKNPYAAPGKKGVTYRITKGGKRDEIRNAFIVTFQSGHVAVVRRGGKKRYKIHQLFGPSVTEVARNNPQLSQAALAPFVDTQLQKNTDYEARRALKLK